MAAASSETAAERRPTPPTLSEVLRPLNDIPQDQRAFGARQLLMACCHLEETQKRLQSRPAPDVETLADQDSTLLSWLAGIFHGISGSQAIIHGELLQPEFTASGMVAPFVQPVPAPSTGARFGVPSSTDVLCDNVSELLRMAAAAIISLYVYLNFLQGPDDLPADEVALTFATVAIHSCAEAANAASVDKQIKQLVEADVQAQAAESAWAQQQQQQQQQQAVACGEQPLFGCAQIRWLMHYVRGMITHYMAAVQHVLGNREAQADCYHAQQKDMQYMCKALPDHPLGYSLFARCAMNGQQMKLAQTFLAKGLEAAQAAGADTSIATMSYQRAAALLLGGAGPRVDAAEVQRHLQEGERAREAVLGWFPAPWTAAAEDGDPDRRLVLTKLLPELERRTGAPLPADGEVDALLGILYVTRPDAAVPPGAIQQLAGADGVEVVAEGQEEEEEEEGQEQQQ